MMEAMQRALEVPHMTFCDEVNADRLGQLRSDLAEAAERRGVRLSYLPLIVKVWYDSIGRPPDACVVRGKLADRGWRCWDAEAAAALLPTLASNDAGWGECDLYVADPPPPVVFFGAPFVSRG